MLRSVQHGDGETGNVSTSRFEQRVVRRPASGDGDLDRALAFESSDEDSWHRLARGYRLAGLLLAAHRMGLLHALTERTPMSVHELSAELLADSHLLAVICRALRAAGLLEKDGVGWRLTPAGDRLASDPAASLELDQMAEDYQLWGQLDLHAHMLFEDGTGVQPVYDNAEVASNQHAARRYARRMTNRRAQQIERLLDHVEPTRPLTVLDAWGGDGYVAREMCDRWSQITCSVVEIPTMSGVTGEACAGYPRIAVITGDMLHDDPGELLLGENVDVVVLSHVLQSLSRERRWELVGQMARVLAPGGCLLSNEYALRWNDRDSLDVLLWAVGRTSISWQGEPLRASEQDMLLRGTGLAAVDSWWVTESTRAVLGVATSAGIEPALHVRDHAHAGDDRGPADPSSARADAVEPARHHDSAEPANRAKRVVPLDDVGRSTDATTSRRRERPSRRGRAERPDRGPRR